MIWIFYETKTNRTRKRKYGRCVCALFYINPEIDMELEFKHIILIRCCSRLYFSLNLKFVNLLIGFEKRRAILNNNEKAAG